MKESDIQTLLSKKHKMEGCFELKLCKTKSIRFDSVKPHQVEALLRAVGFDGLYHKISDFPMFSGSKTRFNSKKPFDFFYLVNTPAYVAICFYVPRVRKTVYYVYIDSWIKAKDASDKKSITEEEIKEISSHTIEL